MAREWLKSLQVGDLVMTDVAHYGPSRWKVMKVERFTKTRIITDDGAQWRRFDGVAPGRDVWHSPQIELFDLVRIEKAKAEAFRVKTVERLRKLAGVPTYEIPAALVDKYGATLQTIVDDILKKEAI
jgi:hypothetical protein